MKSPVLKALSPMPSTVIVPPPKSSDRVDHVIIVIRSTGSTFAKMNNVSAVSIGQTRSGR